jgi:hypothetical protein
MLLRKDSGYSNGLSLFCLEHVGYKQRAGEKNRVFSLLAATVTPPSPASVVADECIQLAYRSKLYIVLRNVSQLEQPSGVLRQIMSNSEWLF